MLKIWTDGSCLGNPGPGGWAFIATDGEHTAERSGGAPDTTNNQMELTAVIRALHATRHHKEIELHTDSQYVKNGMQIWVPQWKNTNWPLHVKFIGFGFVGTPAIHTTNDATNWHAQRPKQ